MSNHIVLSSSFKNFLNKTKTTNKVSEILFKLVVKKHYYPISLTASEINYITNRNDGTISFLPKGKLHLINDDGTWKKEGRQTGKPAKVIKKLFSPRLLSYLKDSDFEAFANQYKSNSALESGFKFEILKNSKIAEVYNMEREEGEGSLNNSCMRDEHRTMFEIYTNCDSLKIVVLLNPMGQLAGRCLLWKLEDGINLMDRFYVAQDSYYESFLEFAEINKFWRKSHYKTYDFKRDFINAEGENVHRVFTVETDTDFGSYPYIDTFSFGKDGYITNSSEDYIYEYNCTDGSRDEQTEDVGFWVESRGEYMCEDDVVYCTAGSYRNQYIAYNDSVEIGGEYFHEDDERIVFVDGEYFDIKSGEVTCINGDWHHNKYCCQDIDGEDYLILDCYLIDGNYYYCEDDRLIRNHTGDVVLKANCTEFMDNVFINGVWVENQYVHTLNNGEEFAIMGIELPIKKNDKIISFICENSPIINAKGKYENYITIQQIRTLDGQIFQPKRKAIFKELISIFQD